MKWATAIVAAGGHGRRLGRGIPKSFVEVQGVQMITLLMRNMGAAGIRRVLLCSDRPEWDRSLMRAAEGLSATIVRNDGVDSTIRLVAQALNYCDESEVVFAYGHAPRPSSHFRSLLTSPSEVVATAVYSTSKEVRIPLIEGLWLEPPYKISREVFCRSQAASWLDFFTTNAPHVLRLAPEAPGEFNTHADLVRFRSYVQRWVPTIRASSCLASP